MFEAMNTNYMSQCCDSLRAKTCCNVKIKTIALISYRSGSHKHVRIYTDVNVYMYKYHVHANTDCDDDDVLLFSLVFVCTHKLKFSVHWYADVHLALNSEQVKLRYLP